MDFQYNDGGRAAAGYKGSTGDCVVRAIAIATGKPYQTVYDEINALAAKERITKRNKRRSNARNGVGRRTYEKYLVSLGWEWHPTMTIGAGCTVHLRADELPTGRLIVRVSKHMVAVIDGVVHDTYDPTRDDTRCVYGYFQRKAPELLDYQQEIVDQITSAFGVPVALISNPDPSSQINSRRLALKHEYPSATEADIDRLIGNEDSWKNLPAHDPADDETEAE